MQAAPVTALRSLIRTGNIKKLLMCFTHFDEVKGDNLPTCSAKRDHVLASAENVMTRLGLKPGAHKEHWTRVKALNRRIANGRSDQYDNLRPVSDLHKQLGELIYVTIQKPIRWEGDEPDEDSRQQTYDDFSSALTGPLLELATQRVRIKHADEWQEALNQSGKGSPSVRAEIIAKEIYDKVAPVPDLTPSPDQNKFLHEVLALVEASCKEQNIGLE